MTPRLRTLCIWLLLSTLLSWSTAPVACGLTCCCQSAPLTGDADGGGRSCCGLAGDGSRGSDDGGGFRTHDTTPRLCSCSHTPRIAKAAAKPLLLAVAPSPAVELNAQETAASVAAVHTPLFPRHILKPTARGPPARD